MLRDPLLVDTFRVHRITTRLHLAILESPLAIPMAEPQLAILEPQPAIHGVAFLSATMERKEDFFYQVNKL